MPINIAKLGSPANASFGASAVTTLLNAPDKDIGIRPYEIANGVKYKYTSFLFDIVEEEEVNYEADITDYWLEDNSPVQDHIAFKPITIKVKGFIGEVADTPPDLLAGLASIVDKLQVLGPWAPGLVVSAQQTYAKINRLYQSYAKLAGATLGALGRINGKGSKPKTKQENAYDILSDIQKNKMLCEVQTPFRTYDKMVIQCITAVQQKESKSIGDFSVTLKQMNFAQTLNVASTKVKRLANKAAPVDDKGATKGVPTSQFFKLVSPGA